MTHPISDIAFTPAVKAAQERNGSRAGYARMEEDGWTDSVTPYLAGYLETRDSFYLGTANADGQPYTPTYQNRAIIIPPQPSKVVF